VNKFVLGELLRKPRASAVSLGSQAMGNMLGVVEKRTEMAENQRYAKSTLQPLYKDFKRGRRFGSNGIKTGVHKFVLGALKRKPRASVVSLGAL